MMFSCSCRAISSRVLRLQRFSSSKIGASLESTQTQNDLSQHFEDPGIPRVALTKDKSTIVMYHPQSSINYEDTIPVPRDDPRYSAHENVESLVREKLDALGIADKPLDKSSPEKPWPMNDRENLPTMVKLADMFYTTKHVWFPKSKKKARDLPQDRRRD